MRPCSTPSEPTADPLRRKQRHTRWLFEEAGGDEAHRLLRDASKVVCSRLTLVETRRVIRRAVAQKLLDEVSSTAVLEVFAQAGAGWAILELSREVAERAEGSFPVEPVRTLDALHLASARSCDRRCPISASSAPMTACARTAAGWASRCFQREEELSPPPLTA